MIIFSRCISKIVKVLIMILLTLYVINLELNPYSFKYKPTSIKNVSLEKALMTGEKRYLKPKSKKALKHLSLLHLFTPSGLHFSSILSLLFFSHKLRLIFIFLALIISFKLGPLYALQRVIWFYAINSILKNTKLSFSMTFLFSLVFNQYELNPLSFLFSFIFWFIIMFFKASSVKKIFLLFITQMSIALIMSSKFNLLSLVINPILTVLITMIFPFLFITFHINIFEQFRLFFYDNLESFINVCDIQILRITPSIFLVIVCLLILHKKKRLFVISFLFFSFNKGHNESLYKTNRSQIYPLAPKSEILKNQKNMIKFIDRRCLKRKFNYVCKKKPSSMGGLSI